MQNKVLFKALSIISLISLVGCTNVHPIDPVTHPTVSSTPIANESNAIKATKEQADSQDTVSSVERVTSELGEITAGATTSEAVRDFFSSENKPSDTLKEYNVKAKELNMSGWYSNMSAEEEKALVDSMNANFKQALIRYVRSSDKNLNGILYYDIDDIDFIKEDIISDEFIDNLILAHYLYADNWESQLRGELEKRIDEWYKKTGSHKKRKYSGIEIDDGWGFAPVNNSLSSNTGSAVQSAAVDGFSKAAEASYPEYDTYYESYADVYDEYDEGSFNTAEYHVIDENGFKSVTASPLSTFSIDVDTAGFTKLKYDILHGHRIDKDEIKIEELINYFNFDYSTDRVENEPFTVSTEYTQCPWNQEHKLVRIGIKADDKHDNLATNYVLVSDISGSMTIVNKLPLALSAYADLLDTFTDEDTISLMYYASGTGVVLDGVKCSEKDKVYDGLVSLLLGAGGGTAGAAGLDTAYKMAKSNLIKDGVNRVIIATDGDFNIGRTSEGSLQSIVESGRKDGIYLTILGYGFENLKDNKMETMAENGNGNYHFIGDMDDAVKALVEEGQSTLIPMADDVKIQVEFNPAVVEEYRLIGYESRLLDAEDFNNDKVDAGEVGAGKSVTVLYEIIPAGGESTVDVPELKYSQVASSGDKSELCTVSIRYKDINSGLYNSESKLISKPVLTESYKDIPDIATALAISVTEYGMVLRDSQYKGDSSLTYALELAKAVNEDTNNQWVASYINILETLVAQSK